MSLRSRITGDLAGIEGDLGRIRLMLAEGEDLCSVITRLEDIRTRVENTRGELIDISLKALRGVSDEERK